MMIPASTPVPSRSALGSLLLACALTVALWFVPVASFALYPLRLFVTGSGMFAVVGPR